jgi:hypothetical protein
VLLVKAVGEFVPLENDEIETSAALRERDARWSRATCARRRRPEASGSAEEIFEVERAASDERGIREEVGGIADGPTALHGEDELIRRGAVRRGAR